MNNSKQEQSGKASLLLNDTTLMFRKVYLLPVTRLLSTLLKHEQDSVRAWSAMALRDVVTSHIFAFTDDEVTNLTTHLMLCALRQKHPQHQADVIECVEDVEATVSEFRAMMQQGERKYEDNYRNN